MRISVPPFACAVLGLCWPRDRSRPGPKPAAHGQSGAREPARGAGTIKGPAMGGMEVVAGGGERYVVHLEPQAQQIEYVGSAELSWLHPGLLVRFSAIVDKRGRLTEPVSHFDVITMRDGYQLGMVTGRPGTVTTTRGAVCFRTRSRKNPRSRPRRRRLPNRCTVTIIGRLGEVKNGKFQVSVPGKTLKGEIAEDAKVSVDYGNLSLVRPGDKIDFQGWSPVGMKQFVYASSITVTATEKLVGESKKKPRAKTRTTEADAEKPDAEKPAQKPDKKGRQRRRQIGQQAFAAADTGSVGHDFRPDVASPSSSEVSSCHVPRQVPRPA